jgi:hypothetical protein
VVDAMGKTLENSLDFTDQTIALLRNHQRESGTKGGHGVEGADVSHYDRVRRCTTNLAQVASQFNKLVLTSHLTSKVPVTNLSQPVLCLHLTPINKASIPGLRHL